MIIPDPDIGFLPILDPGSRGQKGTGSRIRICNTDDMKSVCSGGGAAAGQRYRLRARQLVGYR
jgi:hypothetical protein